MILKNSEKRSRALYLEYKYFSTDGSTKYFDKVSDPNAPEQNANGEELPESEGDEDNGSFYDEDERRRGTR